MTNLEFLREFNPETCTINYSDKNCCNQCGELLSIYDHCEFICPNCSTVTDYIDENNERLPNSSKRLYINGGNIGAEVKYYQRNLDAYSVNDYRDVQKRNIIKELSTMNILHQSNGYCQFPRNILDKVALTYQQVQVHYVRRGNYKRAILAIIMYYSCLSDGFVRPYTEIAKFTNTTCCFSYGADIVRSMVEQNQIILEIDINPLIPFINTILLQLSCQNEKLARDEIIITMNQILQLYRQ